MHPSIHPQSTLAFAGLHGRHELAAVSRNVLCFALAHSRSRVCNFPAFIHIAAADVFLFRCCAVALSCNCVVSKPRCSSVRCSSGLHIEDRLQVPCDPGSSQDRCQSLCCQYPPLVPTAGPLPVPVPTFGPTSSPHPIHVPTLPPQQSPTLHPSAPVTVSPMSMPPEPTTPSLAPFHPTVPSVPPAPFSISPSVSPTIRYVVVACCGVLWRRGTKDWTMADPFCCAVGPHYAVWWLAIWAHTISRRTWASHVIP